MRIRPVHLTATGTFVAFAAVTTVVLATTPDDAGVGLIRLLWAAIFLTLWGLIATLLLIVRQTTAQAVWVGILPALAGVGLLFAWKNGYQSQQLLLGAILATLAVAIFIWRRLRRTRVHD